MVQQGQVFELTRRGRDGERLWAFRYRIGGRGSKRVQRGGFSSEQDARDGLERELRAASTGATGSLGGSPSPSSSRSIWRNTTCSP
jgi:hypothetical protein